MSLARASLILDFARSGRLDSRMITSRADVSACASYVDRNGTIKVASANTPRFTHDPDTFAPLGLLIEPTRVNRFVQSATLDNAAWTKSEVTVTANSTTAPDATLAADSIKPSTSNAAHYLQRDTGTIIGGEGQTVTGFFKAGGYRRLKMRIGTLDDASYGEAIFDVAAGTLVGSPVVAGSATSPVADIKFYRAAGFYRCRLSVSRIDASSTSCRSKFFVLQDDSTVTYAGDGTSFIYGWGLQHERNPSPSSYIPTVSTIVTRAVDRFALTDLSWFNALEGTFLIGVTARFDPGTATVVFSLDDGTVDTSIRLYFDTDGTARLFVTAGAQGQANISGPVAYAAREQAAFAIAYRANDIRFYTDKGEGDGDVSATIPTGFAALRPGMVADATTPLNSALGRILYFPRAMDAEVLRRLVPARLA